MADAPVLVDRRDALAILTLNNPHKLNALDLPLLEALVEALRTLAVPAVRCLIIRGAGDKAFSAGYDIAALPSNPDEDPLRQGSPLEAAIAAVENFPAPVIAMVNGIAYGAGCELACTCDLRVAADHAHFAITPAKLGIVYNSRGLLHFMHLVGLGLTKELFYTGEPVDAVRAERIGLVNRVAPAAELETATLNLAASIARNAPLAVQGIKAVVGAILKQEHVGDADAERLRALRHEALASADFAEGKRAFLEKRPPLFEGK